MVSAVLRVLCVVVALLSVPPAAFASPGALDPTFAGGSGRATAGGGEAVGLALAADGSIVVGGTVQPSWQQFVGMRFTAAGAPAAGYESGARRVSFGSYLNAKALSVAVQPDGKLLLGGYMSRRSGGYPIGVIARFEVNGELDPSFGDGGVVRLQCAAEETPEYVFGIALDPSGGVLFTHSEGPSIGRLTPDGHLDRRVTIPVGTVQSLAALPDGGAVAAGAVTGGAGVVVRVDGSGALDPAWGDGGVARLGADAPLPTAVAAAPGGGAAVAGAKTVGTENAFWAASLDASGHPGFSTTTLLGTGDSSNGRDAHVRALAVQADGKLLVAGSARFEAPGMWQRRGTLVRYLPDGTLDPGFGTDGATTLGDEDSEFYGIKLQPDGRIVTAGLPDMTVTRFENDGAPYVPPAPVEAPAGSANPGGGQDLRPQGTVSLATPVSTGPPPRFTAVVLTSRSARLARGRVVKLRLTAPARLTRVTVELRRGRTVLASRRLSSLTAGRARTVGLTLRRAARLRGLTLRVSANGFTHRQRIV